VPIFFGMLGATVEGEEDEGEGEDRPNPLPGAVAHLSKLLEAAIEPLMRATGISRAEPLAMARAELFHAPSDLVRIVVCCL
jgi:hypothetical protein